MHGIIWDNQAKKCHTSFQNPGIFIGHNINSRCKRVLVESNFERDQKFNQQSEFSKGRPRERRYSDTMYGCIQCNYLI